MAELPSLSSNFDYERDLKVLLDTFSSAVSLEVIAAAYNESNHNLDKAGEIICDMQRSTSTDSTYASRTQSDCSSETFSTSMPESVVQNTLPFEGTGASKLKKCTVSMGTVSGVIGKDYANRKPSTNEPCKVNKPLKIDVGKFPISEILGNEGPSGITAENGVFQDDVEKFLFAMLGDGFQLDQSVVHDVLGSCGYNVRESMEKLLYLSASMLEKSDDVVGIPVTKSTDKCKRMVPRHKEKLQQVDSSKTAREREVLFSLFNAPERIPAFRPSRKPKFRTFGKLVTEPLKDDSSTDDSDSELHNMGNENGVCLENEEEENSYLVLREAVKEHWITMKGYYEAAVDAFQKGDSARASKLLEQGHFYGRKAREADEKSAQKIIQRYETKTGGQVVSISIINQKPKEAKQLLKSHLTCLSGIPSIFQYLKVIVGPSDNKSKKASCKQLITKLLDRESIEWSEEQNGDVLLIRVDLLDPEKLSFAKESQ